MTYPDNTVRRYEFGGYFGYQLAGVKNELGRYVRRFGYDTSALYNNAYRANASSLDGTTEKVTLEYGAGGITVATDALGNAKTYTTSFSAGKYRLVAVTGAGCSGCGPSGAAFTHDPWGRVLTATDANGNVTQYSYDIGGNVLTVTEAYGAVYARTTAFEYDAAGRVVAVWAPDGGVVRYGYDSRGNLTSYTDASGSTTVYAYDARGLMVSTTDAVGNESLLGYDEHGNLVHVENALGHVTDLSRDVMGRLLGVTVAGLTTAYEYDARGRRTRMIAPDGGTTRYEYDLAGNLTAVVDPTGVRVTWKYDTANRVRKVTDASGSTVTLGYDAESNVISRVVSSSSGSTVSSETFSYDADGRLRRVTHANGTYLEYVRDGNGNILSTIDEGGRTRSFVYDGLSRLTAVSDPMGRTSSSTYDSVDNLLARTDPLGSAITYAHDASGRVTQISSYEAGSVAYQYDAAGFTRFRQDAYGSVLYERDALRRVVRAYDPVSGWQTTVTYDACLNGIGRICAVSDAFGATEFEYDVLGRVARRTTTAGGHAYVTAASHDSAGRIQSLTYPSGRILQFNYVNGNLSAVQVGGAFVVSGVRNVPFGGIAELVFGNGVLQRQVHDLQGRITSIAAPPVISRGYRYDAAGNTVGVDDALDLGNNRSFAYDLADRLTSATGPWGTIEYAYDAAGNRVSQQVGTDRTEYEYAGNRVIGASGASPFSLAYAAGGAPTVLNEKGLAYDSVGRLSQVSVDGAAIVAFSYNAWGQRATKTNSLGSVLYHYDFAGNLLAESTGSGQVTAEYLFLGGVPIAKFEGDRTYFYHADPLGTPQRMSDSSGNVVWAAETMPFGDAWSLQGTVISNLRFPGQYYDWETGFHQNHYRDYSPELGRYLEPDPLVVTNLRLPVRYDEPPLGTGISGGNQPYLQPMGRYTELDPIALPGAFNGQYGPDWYKYANDNPLKFDDPTGLLVTGVYDCNTGQFTVTDLDSGASAQMLAESGGKPYGDPIPDGLWEILERQGKDDLLPSGRMGLESAKRRVRPHGARPFPTPPPGENGGVHRREGLVGLEAGPRPHLEDAYGYGRRPVSAMVEVLGYRLSYPAFRPGLHRELRVLTAMRTLLAPVALAAVIIAAAPSLASLGGADSVRGLLGGGRTAGALARFALLAYTTLVAAMTLRRASPESWGGLVVRTIAAVAVLGGVVAGAASAWSPPSRSADAQEWLVLFACPLAGLIGALAATTALVVGARTPASGHAWPVRAAMVVGVVSVLAYVALRLAGTPTLARVAPIIAGAATVSALLLVVTLDSRRRLAVRGGAGLVTGVIVTALLLL